MGRNVFYVGRKDGLRISLRFIDHPLSETTIGDPITSLHTSLSEQPINPTIGNDIWPTNPPIRQNLDMDSRGHQLINLNLFE